MPRKQKKIPVGILGATGLVGQEYVHLLRNHPWFSVVYLAASKNSAGKTYKKAVAGRWHIKSQIPKECTSIKVDNINNIKEAAKKCAVIFSAVKMPSHNDIKKLELAYSKAGMAVFSNNSAHRFSKDVPLLIPEINASHIREIVRQQKHYKIKGFIVVKPNCSLQSYLLPVYALLKAGYDIKKIMVTTMQAISGAGATSIKEFGIAENVIPYIDGEEEKTEQEPLKILKDYPGLKISAHCNRVPVVHGHMACVSVLFGKRKPSQKQILQIWKNFKALPQQYCLPLAPKQPIRYYSDNNRPQPLIDRDEDKAMAVSVGRLRKCPVLDYKFVGLSHNLVRGAAGGNILNAELLYKMGYIKHALTSKSK
ncbi:MAG: aspartate-semialdehyde dehydrogenase [Patescibacteria group bacterium]|jgi:aspartate-semialdehyde dehydrogenase